MEEKFWRNFLLSELWELKLSAIDNSRESKLPNVIYDGVSKPCNLFNTKNHCSAYHLQQRVVVQIIAEENAPSLFKAEWRCCLYCQGGESVTVRFSYSGESPFIAGRLFLEFWRILPALKMRTRQKIIHAYLVLPTRKILNIWRNSVK